MDEDAIDSQAALELTAARLEQESRYARIIAYVCSTPWAVTPEMLAIITGILEFRSAGGVLTREEIQARVAEQPQPKGQGAGRAGNVAVIPVHGVISHRSSLFSQVSGMNSVETTRARLRQALADTNVGSIVLDVDSPGGSVDGIPELAAEIFAARKDKPIVAVANTRVGSAAYWLASQASELVATPSGAMGSIGVYGVHEDRSAQQAKRGVKTTLISAGKYKTEGHPFGPLSEEAQAALQANVNEYYDMFVEAVARGRGVKADAVRNGMGEGRMVSAQQAVKLGMADKIATLDETVARLRGAAKPAAMPVTTRTDDTAAAAPAPRLASARLGRQLAVLR